MQILFFEVHISSSLVTYLPFLDHFICAYICVCVCVGKFSFFWRISFLIVFWQLSLSLKNSKAYFFHRWVYSSRLVHLFSFNTQMSFHYLLFKDIFIVGSWLMLKITSQSYYCASNVVFCFKDFSLWLKCLAVLWRWAYCVFFEFILLRVCWNLWFSRCITYIWLKKILGYYFYNNCSTQFLSHLFPIL